MYPFRIWILETKPYFALRDFSESVLNGIVLLIHIPRTFIRLLYTVCLPVVPGYDHAASPIVAYYSLSTPNANCHPLRHPTSPVSAIHTH